MTTDAKKARVTMEGTLPPGYDGIIAAYPLTVFNPESVKLSKTPGCFIVLDGRRMPMTGIHYDMSRGYAVCLGQFLAFHVENSTEDEQTVSLVVHGRGLDAGEQAGRGFFRGLFVPAEVV